MQPGVTGLTATVQGVEFVRAPAHRHADRDQRYVAAAIFLGAGVWSAVLAGFGDPVLSSLAALVWLEFALSGFRVARVTGAVVEDNMLALRLAPVLVDVCRRLGCALPRVALRDDALRPVFVRRSRGVVMLTLSQELALRLNDRGAARHHRPRDRACRVWGSRSQSTPWHVGFGPAARTGAIPLVVGPRRRDTSRHTRLARRLAGRKGRPQRCIRPFEPATRNSLRRRGRRLVRRCHRGGPGTGEGNRHGAGVTRRGVGPQTVALAAQAPVVDDAVPSGALEKDRSSLELEGSTRLRRGIRPWVVTRQPRRHRESSSGRHALSPRSQAASSHSQVACAGLAVTRLCRRGSGRCTCRRCRACPLGPNATFSGSKQRLRAAAGDVTRRDHRRLAAVRTR